LFYNKYEKVMEMKEKYTELRSRIKAWREEHYKSKVLPFLRVLFGMGVFYKIIEFVRDGGAKVEAIMCNSHGYGSWVFAHWVPMVGIAAAILIAAGLLTRVASLIILPIFLGGMILGKYGIYSAFEQSHFLLSLVLFIGSVFFSIIGSGYYSSDRAIEEENRREEEFYWRK
jgi:putative oxidoreductase